jgi:hypothetical protein
MTDEERQRAMDFIVAQQAKNSVEIEKLSESHRNAEGRLDRSERILKLMVRAGARARRDMRERDKQLHKQDVRWERRFTELSDFQAHSDRRLDALIDIVRAKNNGRS